VGRLTARKRFGQHFLERAWADKVVAAIAPSSRDVFLEIGPGRGAMTRPLAERVQQVIAVEIDRDLAADLRAAAIPRTTILTADFLDTTASGLEAALRSSRVAPGSPVRVAGNLPYNVASPILFRLCDLHAEGLPITDATLMLQREVADRLTAAPGSSNYGVLTILIQLVATVNRLLDLPPGAFRPPPKVRSTVVRLSFHAPAPRPGDLALFTSLVRSAFTRRRKTLANALRANAWLDARAVEKALAAAGIDGGRRPETLEIAEFVRLADAIHAHD
jgi:16S rRNA (adenine1518-N6/adenine1519-N6)-dimethyltransferase